MAIAVNDYVKVLAPFDEWFVEPKYLVTAVSDDGQCVSILVSDMARDFDPAYLEVV